MSAISTANKSQNLQGREHFNLFVVLYQHENGICNTRPRGYVNIDLSSFLPYCCRLTEGVYPSLSFPDQTALQSLWQAFLKKARFRLCCVYPEFSRYSLGGFEPLSSRKSAAAGKLPVQKRYEVGRRKDVHMNAAAYFVLKPYFCKETSMIILKPLYKYFYLPCRVSPRGLFYYIRQLRYCLSVWLVRCFERPAF